MTRNLRIAFVVMRYGEEISGGAEQHARILAEHLSKHAQVHVITTCALTEEWSDYFPPGSSKLNGVTIHRFPVDHPRNYKKLENAAHVFHGKHTIADELEWIQAQGPTSSKLMTFIEEKRHYMDAFLFFTFEHATTYFGMPLVSKKSILLPLAHDHPFTRSGIFRHLLHLPSAIAYNTHASRNLVNRTTGNQHVPYEVVGVGVNKPVDIDPQRFRDKYNIAGDFLLYIGRIHAGKNVPNLLDFYQQYYDQGRQIPLVLIGKEMLPVPDLPNIIRPGHVSEQDKFDALAAASVFILPSLYESLSMVTLEAWSTGTPVLVNGGCEVVRSQVSMSNGGLYYRNYSEFETCLELLLRIPELNAKLGAQGKKFVTENYEWDVVINKILRLVKRVVEL